MAMPDRHHTALAHWTEQTVDGRTLLCADTARGETIVLDVTDSSYGGVVREVDDAE